MIIIFNMIIIMILTHIQIYIIYNIFYDNHIKYNHIKYDYHNDNYYHNTLKHRMYVTRMEYFNV